MAERRSARLKAKADIPASAELSSQEFKRTSKRKFPPPNNDKPVSKALKTESRNKGSNEKSTSQQSKAKNERVTKEISQPPVQVPANTSNGPFSSLPPETMNLVLEKIKDKASLANLGKTSKAFHSLVMPQLYKRVEASVKYHAHIAKLIRSIEPALTIEQRKQLRKEGQYKGQQDTFPKVGWKPEIANFIRQAAFDIGDPGKKHRFIIYRYIEELLKSASNLRVFAATDFTESMTKSLAACNHLRSLHLKISEGRMPDALPLTTIKGLRHLHLETADVYTTEDSPLTLIWNSRSTLRSLTLDKSCFQHFYKNKMDRTEELNGSPERRYDFTTLKSLSLQRVSWLMDPDEVDAVTRAIDFTALESLDLSQKNMRISLLFQRLKTIFASTERTNMKLRRLSLSLLGDQAFTSRGDQTTRSDEEEEAGLEVISSFDTLTSLTVCVHSSDLPNPVMKDILLQGILRHKNLSTLEFINTFSLRYWDTPYLDAKTVAVFIDNLPKLRHFRFRSTALHLSEIAKALSRGCNLETIRMEIPSASEREAKELGVEFIHDLVFPILERDSDRDEKVYRWEDHSKINQVILDVAVWEIGSEFGPFKKGMKKAEKVTSSSDPKRKVMYRDVTRPTYLWMRTRFDDIRGWVDEVEKDFA